MSVTAAAALSGARPHESAQAKIISSVGSISKAVDIQARFLLAPGQTGSKGSEKIIAPCRGGQPAAAVSESKGELGAACNERRAGEQNQRLPMSVRIEEHWLEAIKGGAICQHVRSMLAKETGKL